jgi:hypothetical protein
MVAKLGSYYFKKADMTLLVDRLLSRITTLRVGKETE